ncbi:hypothetical protein Tco_0839574 [Tanacetum coccineum]|uniref:Uncharacterized protein n=1 Tax=Tanacetum coccineum TaxID=301880 RepID=A0ABQ5AU60_9ASTR
MAEEIVLPPETYKYEMNNPSLLNRTTSALITDLALGEFVNLAAKLKLKEAQRSREVIYSARLVSESNPKPTQRRPSWSAFRDSLWSKKAHAGPGPVTMKEDQTGSDSGKLHVSLAGPNPEHMDDEFLATAYPKVHENLKLITTNGHSMIIQKSFWLYVSQE